MATNWSQENCDGSTVVEREAARYMRVRCDALASAPTPQNDRISTNRAEAELPPAAGNTPWKSRFIGWDVMLAVLAAVMIFFLLDVVSFGILSSAVTVAGIVAAVGLGHYLLWGRVFGRRVVREGQRVEAQDRELETSGTKAPDDFLLALNDRQRKELLQLIEHSLPAATAGDGSEDGSAIRRELQDTIRMYGA
jgi:hypothetical protein